MKYDFDLLVREMLTKTSDSDYRVAAATGVSRGTVRNVKYGKGNTAYSILVQLHKYLSQSK